MQNWNSAASHFGLALCSHWVFSTLHVIEGKWPLCQWYGGADLSNDQFTTTGSKFVVADSEVELMEPEIQLYSTSCMHQKRSVCVLDTVQTHEGLGVCSIVKGSCGSVGCCVWSKQALSPSARCTKQAMNTFYFQSYQRPPNTEVHTYRPHLHFELTCNLVIWMLSDVNPVIRCRTQITCLGTEIAF